MKRYTDCAAVREDLSAYFDGELLPEDREAMDAHLSDCAECLRQLNTLKRVDDAYAKLTAMKAPAGFEATVRAAVNSGKTTTLSRRSVVPRWAGPLVAVAAAAIVMLGGVLLLEWQQGGRTEIALAPAEGIALRQNAADSAVLESPATPASDAPGGDWDSFTRSQAGARNVDEVLGSGTPESPGAWQGFVRGGVPDSAEATIGIESVESQDLGIGEGRADEAISRPSEVATSPAPQDVSAGEGAREGDASGRAAVLGEPPSTLSTRRAEALKDAASESELSESAAKAAIERRADAAEESGEVVERTKLRSFRVGADGVWYEVGYSGETTTSLPRDSDALRELMKKYPEFDWNKLLTRSARQVFQLDGAWYALEAGPEQ